MFTADDFRAVGMLLEMKYPGLLHESKVNHWTVAHFIAAFGTAEYMRQLCTSCPQAIYRLTFDGLTPLQVAIQYGNLGTAGALLESFKQSFESLTRNPLSL